MNGKNKKLILLSLISTIWFVLIGAGLILNALFPIYGRTGGFLEEAANAFLAMFFGFPTLLLSLLQGIITLSLRKDEKYSVTATIIFAILVIILLIGLILLGLSKIVFIFYAYAPILFFEFSIIYRVWKESKEITSISQKYTHNNSLKKIKVVNMYMVFFGLIGFILVVIISFLLVSLLNRIL